MRTNGQPRPPNSMNDTICKLFIGNINKSTTDEDFRAYFEKYGGIKDIILMRDTTNPSQNRGFGFVTPEAVETADRILLDGNHQLDGRDLDIKRALPKEIDDPLLHVRTPRIFLGGLPHNITEEELTSFFNEKYSELGSVKEILIKKDRQSGRPRGFCFISFDNDHVVDKILIEQRYPIINNKRCEVRKADPAVPISGAPPSQLQRYPVKNVPSYGPRDQGRPRYPPPQQMNVPSGHPIQQMGQAQSPNMAYGSSVPATNQSYNYSYPQAGGNVVGYPSSNAYYNSYYTNAQPYGSPYQMGQPGLQGGYSMPENNRVIKPSYQKSHMQPTQGLRGRPY